MIYFLKTPELYIFTVINGFGNFTQQYSFAGHLGDFGDLDGDGYLDIASFLSNAEIGTFNNDQEYSDPDIHSSS
ncbi:MAG: hypothetical protein R2942_07910 [Ignavibacteria bacterium]